MGFEDIQKSGKFDARQLQMIPLNPEKQREKQKLRQEYDRVFREVVGKIAEVAIDEGEEAPFGEFDRVRVWDGRYGSNVPETTSTVYMQLEGEEGKEPKIYKITASIDAENNHQVNGDLERAGLETIEDGEGRLIRITGPDGEQMSAATPGGLRNSSRIRGPHEGKEVDLPADSDGGAEVFDFIQDLAENGEVVPPPEEEPSEAA